MEESYDQVGAVILAAGLSRRMGQPKLALPWGNTTVIGQVAQVLLAAGAAPVIAVTGSHSESVQRALGEPRVQCVRNPTFSPEDMVGSLKAGLLALPPACRGTLVALGDQPQIELGVVGALLGAYRQAGVPLVVPSYNMRRGHPWVLDRSLFPDILALQPGQTLRDLLGRYAAKIHYLVVDSPSILQDLDTPDDYAHQRPR